MKTFNNELVVHRGESFTIDRLLVNKDGSPYIISNQLLNPRFVITVSDSKYSQSNRYVKRYLLDLSDFPKFLCTQPIDLLSIKVSSDSLESKYSDFPNESLSGYIDGQLVEFDKSDDAVFFITENGKKTYKYFDGEKWLNYSCRIVKSFIYNDTIEWSSQDYLYSIILEDDSGVIVPILSPTKLSVLNNL